MSSKSYTKPTTQNSLSSPPSPASSTSTLKAAPSCKSDSNAFSSHVARSKGQLARRYTITDSVASSGLKTRLSYNYDAISSLQPSKQLLPPDSQQYNVPAAARKNLQSHQVKVNRTAKPDKTKPPRPQQPLLGGFYFSDIIVVAFFYSLNLFRTCGLAELLDVAFKGVTYVFTRLPMDFYQRWYWSKYPSSETHSTRFNRLMDAEPESFQRLGHQTKSHSARLIRPSKLDTLQSQRQASVSASSEQHTVKVKEGDDQVSPFYHLVILLVRFACTSFPHLLPRVLFAEETIGPLVRWRTGGGAAGIVREFTNDPKSPDPINDSYKSATNPDPTPSFRAFWIGADAHIPVQVRRSDQASKHTTTVLYLHGGGFSLGSVAFYAEALIRIMAKITQIEDVGPDARCIAVEYDLSPSARFPQPLLQSLRCYAHLIQVEGIDPSAITIVGDSAGGNLAMSMLLCLNGQARNEPLMGESDWSKLPMPAKVVLISPWVDLRPSRCFAFSALRNSSSCAKSNSTSNDPNQTVSSKPRDSNTSIWTEAMAVYDWDYVAAEALLHFAQVYSGVLSTPRRVRGPIGWVANFCAVLAGESLATAAPGDTASAASGNGLPDTSDRNPLNRLLRWMIPSKSLAKAAHTALTEPLLQQHAAWSTSAYRSDVTAASQVFVSGGGALDPIFPRNERKTDTVPSLSELYIPTWKADPTANKSTQPSTQFQQAVERLESHVLINPAIGDWSSIHLSKGMLVIWGERERMAEDIDAWVCKLRSCTTDSQSGARVQTMSGPDQPNQDDAPGQDGTPSISQAPVFKQETSAPTTQSDHAQSPRREWVCTAVEHGPAGVHAWPFVSMYLAGTETEREKGLELIARFVANISPSSSSIDLDTPRSVPLTPLSVPLNEVVDGVTHSPLNLDHLSPVGSMPSDVGTYDQQECDYLFHSDDAERWEFPISNNELGLQGTTDEDLDYIYPHETVWTVPTPTLTSGSVSLEGDRDKGTESPDNKREQGDLSPRVGLGFEATEIGVAENIIHSLRKQNDNVPSQKYVEDVKKKRQVTSEPAHPNEKEEPADTKTDTDRERRIIGDDVSRHINATTEASQSSQPWLWRETEKATIQIGSVAQSSARIHVTAGPSFFPRGMSLAEAEALDAEDSLIASHRHEWSDHLDPVRRRDPLAAILGEDYEDEDEDGEDDDLYDDQPLSHLDVAAQRMEHSLQFADDEVALDPGFFGLCHYSVVRPEGLSDIAEEDSQFDASSIASGAGRTSSRSPPVFSDEAGSPHSISPPSRWPSSATNTATRYTPTATEMGRLRDALEQREKLWQQRFERRAPDDIDDLGVDSNQDTSLCRSSASTSFLPMEGDGELEPEQQESGDDEIESELGEYSFDDDGLSSPQVRQDPPSFAAQATARVSRMGCSETESTLHTAWMSVDDLPLDQETPKKVIISPRSSPSKHKSEVWW